MASKRLPVRPDLTAISREADELLASLRDRTPTAIERWHAGTAPSRAFDRATIADVREFIAHEYSAPSWERLVTACRLVNAIWEDDAPAVRAIVTRQPAILHEPALIRESNWGPPMSYAANLGRDEIIVMLHGLGATDLDSAFNRAVLQSAVGTARMLHELRGRPALSPSCLADAAYTLSVPGTELLFELGYRFTLSRGATAAPVDVVLQTDSRDPLAKHRILALYAEHGYEFDDTPVMAFHRGRRDLLAAHVARDRSVLNRTFDYVDFFPPALGCHAETFARTSLDGVTLLHACVEFEEFELADWLIAEGASVNTPAKRHADGTGAHTALFHAVVRYANFWENRRSDAESRWAALLLRHGADPNAHATLREQRTYVGIPPDAIVYPHVTPVGWGNVFPDRSVVSLPAIRAIVAAGGH
jgi:hypothetical protein